MLLVFIGFLHEPVYFIKLNFIVSSNFIKIPHKFKLITLPRKFVALQSLRNHLQVPNNYVYESSLRFIFYCDENKSASDHLRITWWCSFKVSIVTNSK